MPPIRLASTHSSLIPLFVMINYQITPYHPEAHLFLVSIDIETPDVEGQVLSLPAWIPGSYMIRDFAKNIITIVAETDDGPIAVTQLDKQTWQLDSVFKAVRVSYQVYAWDLSVRTAYLDQFRGYFNGSSLFMKVHGTEFDGCGIEICPPEGDIYSDWRVATTLESNGALPLQFGHYKAADYSDLIDHPVEMGVFSSSQFCVNGVPHDVVISGSHRADLARLCSDLKKICTAQCEFFGSLPLDRYLFLVTAVGDGYGGLEHKYSTSLLCSRDDLPTSTDDKEITDGYRRFLGLCSHEYFHLWNVKRIRPEAFIGCDLQSECYTRQLWVFEGITSYYDELMLVRSAVISVESYLELIAHTISRVVRGQGRFKQTLEESSFNAWTKFYKQDENSANSIVSYYAKGALLALSLDLKIRKETEGKKSLDNVMRSLWCIYGEKDIGVPENAFEKVASEVTGVQLESFFQRYLRATDDLPLAAQLNEIGINMVLRGAKSSDDLGGLVKQRSDMKQQPTLGIKFSSKSDAVKVLQVFDRGAGQCAGLSAGDEIIAIDGLKVTPKYFDELVASCPMGSAINLHVFRRDELINLVVKPKLAALDTCEFMLNEDASSEMISNRNVWLHQNEL